MGSLNCPSINNRHLRYLVRVRGDRDRQLILLGVILTLIAVALYINLTIMLSRRSSKSKLDPLINETNQTTIDIPTTITTTSTTVQNIVTSSLTTITQNSFTSSASTPLITRVSDSKETYINHSLGEPLEYETSGRPLDNTLYYSFMQFATGRGYIHSVSLRLFKEWQGNMALYIFIIRAYTDKYSIIKRYPINPQLNTTQWQTIRLPRYELLIQLGTLVGIGMQDNNGYNNQIYGIESEYGPYATNITANTTIFSPRSDYTCGVAFSYAAVYNVSKPPI